MLIGSGGASKHLGVGGHTRAVQTEQKMLFGGQVFLKAPGAPGAGWWERDRGEGGNISMPSFSFTPGWGGTGPSSAE